MKRFMEGQVSLRRSFLLGIIYKLAEVEGLGFPREIEVTWENEYRPDPQWAVSFTCGAARRFARLMIDSQSQFRAHISADLPIEEVHQPFELRFLAELRFDGEKESLVVERIR